ncbi:BRCT domain protein [Aspergillus homomorphus CBS 101889]|uniref:Uncharacterized protein n=1 Tax=Aspergillus homomorphus (strain CBS 101889) TaxID=1450537 RepID=A0A395HI59_ASPHC|nr:hypothetical protein BO97DRAFT_464546 [Aspergillus homomorphus CBS 101889]RAL07179.1 hypothetical protein BO97DRAFT_464546 [Aspergillus homomorphus CBS 101889]
MGKTFQKIHACSAGKFPKDGQKIPQWITANGGQYSSTICRSVTHLITTLEAYKKNIQPVREAKEHGKIKIITFDWLEDSLLSKDKKPKRVTEYLLKTKVKNEQKKEKSAREASRNTKSADPGATMKKKGAAKKSTGKTKNPDPFGKATSKLRAGSAVGVRYDIVLVRMMLSRKSREKIHIKIYESKDEPHVYTTHFEYSRAGTSSFKLLTPLGTNLKTAMGAFEAKFKSKAGTDWANRSDGIVPLPKLDEEGNQLPAHQGWYYYEDNRSILSRYLQSEATSTVDEQETLVRRDEGAGDPNGIYGADKSSDLHELKVESQGATTDSRLGEDSARYDGDDDGLGLAEN